MLNETEDYNILFCFATENRGIDNQLISSAEKMGLKLNIENANKLGDLLINQRLSSFCCLILQEYVDIMNPISLDLLVNVSEITDVRISCFFDEDKRKKYCKELYNHGLYDCFFGNDAEKYNIEELLNIFIKGRTEEEAKVYYGIIDREKIDIVEDFLENLNDAENKYIDRMLANMNDNDYARLIVKLTSKDIDKLLISEKFCKFYNEFQNKFIRHKSKKKSNIFDKFIARDKKVKYVTRKNIAVISISEKSGCTFIATSLSHLLSKKMKVDYIEFPMNVPYMYYYFGIDFYGYNPNFEQNVFKCIRENTTDDIKLCNIKKIKNISWMFNSPKYKLNEWSVSDMYKALYLDKESDVVILDVGSNLFQKSFRDTLEQFYMVIVVIDSILPSITANLENFLTIKECVKSSCNIKYVVNKNNCGIDKKQLTDILGFKPDVYVNAFEYKYICDSAYNFNLPTYHKQVYAEMDRALKPITEEIFK